MEPIAPTQQVWIFIKESDQWHHKPLFLALLDFLRREGVAGATVLRGLAGYGARGQVHTATLVELASELPVVIIFVDRADRVARIMPQLTEMVQVGLISTTPVTVIQTGHRTPGLFPAHLTVADVMSRDVAQVQPDTPVSEIVTLLIDRALRALPVVDAAHRVDGIITDGDLLTRGPTDLSVDLQRALPLAERAAQVATLADQPHRAADLMTPNPVTLRVTTPLAQAAAVMADRHLKRLPVVDEQSRLIGMVSRSDLLKTVAEGLRQRPAEPLQLPAGAPTTVGGIMLHEVPSVYAATPLAETLDRLLETDKRRAIVVDDDNRVVGIITDGDVVERAAKRARPGGLRALLDWLGGGARPESLEVAARGRTAADVMTSPVVTVTPETSIPEAIRLMMAHKIKRLPVVDANSHLVGLVGRAGLLAAVSHRQENAPSETM
jgi:CBS-domain-containing membrane protein/PII-like signaling protein